MYFETRSKPMPLGSLVVKASRTSCNGDAKIKWWYWCRALASKPKRRPRALSRMWLFSFVISKIIDAEPQSAAKRLVPCWLHKHLLNLFDLVVMATVTRWSTLKMNDLTSDTLGSHWMSWMNNTPWILRFHYMITGQSIVSATAFHNST